MSWAAAEVRAWQAIINSIERDGGSREYLERAYKARNYFQLVLERQ